MNELSYCISLGVYTLQMTSQRERSLNAKLYELFSYLPLGIFDVVCLTSQHYQGGMKHKYKVRQCSKQYPHQTQYQKEKIFYIAAEEVVWDYSPSRTWERELHHLQREKYGDNFSL